MVPFPSVALLHMVAKLHVGSPMDSRMDASAEVEVNMSSDLGSSHVLAQLGAGNPPGCLWLDKSLDPVESGVDFQELLEPLVQLFLVHFVLMVEACQGLQGTGLEEDQTQGEEIRREGVSQVNAMASSTGLPDFGSHVDLLSGMKGLEHLFWSPGGPQVVSDFDGASDVHDVGWLDLQEWNAFLVEEGKGRDNGGGDIGQLLLVVALFLVALLVDLLLQGRVIALVVSLGVEERRAEVSLFLGADVELPQNVGVLDGLSELCSLPEELEY